MTRRTAALALLGLALAGCGPGPRPDVVLISIDSLRPDHMSCYGYPFATSPSIDRLAREGVRFQTALSTSSWTLPAHAALLTGLYDSGHGLIDNGLRLNESQVTAAEVFARQGWRTGGFFGGPYLHPDFGFGQGFETYQSCMTQVDDRLDPAAVRAGARARDGASHADVTGPRTVAEVTRWLATVGDDPIFLFVHLWDVHYDFRAPAQYVELFDPDYQGALTGVDFMGNPAIAPGMDERDYRHLMALYDAEIRFTDDTVAQLLEALRARGRMQDTLLVITADHGEEFLEHGTLKHGYQLFEETLRVPLLLRVPGQQARRASNAVVQHIDLAPTLLELVGLPIPAQFQGQSLVPLFSGGDLQARPVVSETSWRGIDLAAARLGDWKLIEDRQTGERRLFDLASDPGERVDLRAGHPDLVERLAATIELVCRPLPDLEMHGLSGPRDAEAERALQALGYFGK